MIGYATETPIKTCNISLAWEPPYNDIIIIDILSPVVYFISHLFSKLLFPLKKANTNVLEKSNWRIDSYST